MNNGDKIILEGEVVRCMTAYNSGERYKIKIGNQEIWFTLDELEKANYKKED